MYEVKKESVKFTDFTMLEYISDMGNYNNLPKPFEEAKIEDYYFRLFSYTPNYIEFRQVRLEEGGKIYNTQIFYFHDEAYALVNTNYQNDIKVFRIGCDHDWIRETIAMHEHIFTCKKCSYKQRVNSSD